MWDLYVGDAIVRFRAINWQRLTVSNANAQLEAKVMRLWDMSNTSGVSVVEAVRIFDKVTVSGGTVTIKGVTWDAYNMDDQFISLSAGTVTLYDCQADVTGVTATFVNITAGTFRAYNSRFGNDAAYYVISQTNAPTVEFYDCFIQGSYQAVCLLQNTGTLRLVGCQIKNNRTSSVSYCVEAVGSGGKIMVDRCRLIQASGPATINSLYCNVARNIVNWGSSATHAKHANVTIVGDTTYTIDATNVW
ncbi:MAG: hypothetical protein IPF79_04580 [Ignavibacteria bacterium]|nr:hypothetical protein [Ignavibacteria bacterium]